MTKRILAILLSVTMIVTFLPAFAAAENVEVTAEEYTYDEAYYDLYLYSGDTTYLFELTEDLVYGKTYTYADMEPLWTCTLNKTGYAEIYATDATLTVTKDETDLVHIVGTMTLNGSTHNITYDEPAFAPSGTEYTIEGTIGDNSGYNSAFGFYVYIATTTFNDKTYTFQLALDSENGIGTFGSDKVKLNYCLLYDDDSAWIEFCKTASDFVATQDDAGNISVAGSLYVANGDKYIFNLTKAATTYTVTDDTATGANGSISFDKTSAAEGDTVTVTVNPAEGYQLKTLKYNDGEDHEITKDDTTGDYQFTMPACAVTVTAEFGKKAFEISIVDNNPSFTNGTTTGYFMIYGQANDGLNSYSMYFMSKKLTGEFTTEDFDPYGTWVSDKSSGSNIFYDSSLEAAITGVADENGNIVYTGTLSLTDFYGNPAVISVNITVPAFESAITNGAPEASVDVNNGYLVIDKETSVANQTITVTPTAAEGYQLKSLTFKGVTDEVATEITKDATTGKYQFIMPACAVTVTAEFEEIPVSGGKTLPYSFDFETDFLDEGWANFDADGDEQDWITGTNNYVNQGFGMDLSNCAISQSYANNIGSYNSDNWLFSPALVIPEGGATISWYEQSQDPVYPDSYMVYVGECVGEEAVASVYDVATNPTGTTVELYSGVAANPWTQRSVELSAEEYGGKTVYIAFRHLCEDCYWLEIDNFAAEELEATGYGIILDDGTTIPGVKNESQTEFLEYSVQTTLSAGDMFQLYDFGNGTPWTEGNIDDASTPNIAINGYNVYEVSADGTYTFVIKVYDSGYCEVYVGYESATPTHTHSFTYAASDNVLTATCVDGCDDGLDENPLTLTLIAPADLAYDGNVKAFTFAAGEADAWEAAGLELPDITYCIKQSGQSEYMPLLGTLKDVGNYMAQITVDEKTAQVEFSINKGMPYIETNPVPSDITFGEKLSDSTLFGGYAQVSSTNSTQIAGLFEWTEPNTVPAIADSDVTLYDVTFTPVDEDNYMAVTCQVTITVNHTHAPVLVNGQAATGSAAGFKDYYECACGDLFEDEAGEIPIDNLEAWKAAGGAGYIAPLPYAVTDFNGDPVEPGEDTYLEKDDGIHVYTFDLVFTGETDKNLIMEPTCDEIYLEDMTIAGDLITAGGESSIVVYMNDSTIEGDFIATKDEEEMYPCVHVTGDNAIKGDVVSDTTFTVYGEPGATLQVASVTAEEYLVLQNTRLDNVKEDYVFGETTTLTPTDESEPITLTVKANVNFEDEETFVINNGKPFAFGEELEIGTPTVFDENGVAFDPQPELYTVYYVILDDGYYFEQLDGVPTEEGDYCVFFAVPEDDPDYCGVASYMFSIGHNIQKVEGKAATETEAGYKDYYYCEGCDTYFEDAEGETPIDDLDAWKAEGGAGYVAPTEPTATGTEVEPTATGTEVEPTATGTEVEPTSLLGDANNDGVVNMKDLLTIRKVMAGIGVKTYNEVNADCNVDGDVNMKDVLMLRQFLASIILVLGA